MQTATHSDDIIPKIAPEQCSAIQTALHSDDIIPKFLLRSSAMHWKLQRTLPLGMNSNRRIFCIWHRQDCQTAQPETQREKITSKHLCQESLCRHIAKRRICVWYSWPQTWQTHSLEQTKTRSYTNYYGQRNMDNTGSTVLGHMRIQQP